MKNILGTTDRPRISVFRSNCFLTGQLIDDEKSLTLASVTTKGIAGKTPVEKAKEAGKKLGKLIKDKEIGKVTFDRNDFRYHGQIAAFAEGVRESGITF